MKTTGLSLILCFSLPALAAASSDQNRQEPKEPESEERIVTLEEAERAAHPKSTLPLRILFYPHRAITSGMEKGLVRFEEKRMRERLEFYRSYLAERGIIPLFGGLGEGAGFGGGAVFSLHRGENHGLQLLGRASFKGYQEFEVQWKSRASPVEFSAEASYQWRPQENFYGLGHGSNRLQRSDFALRQTWTGVRIAVQPSSYLQCDDPRRLR